MLCLRLCLRRVSTIRSPRVSTPRAFTLVELLLVLATIGLLVALFMGHLGEVRRTALRVRTLASLGSCAQIFHAYSNDWRDSWPAFAVPGPNPTTIPLAGDDTIVVQFYFLSSIMWQYALADGYFGGNYFDPTMFPAETVAYFGGGGNPFMYPCTYLTDPGYWRSETRAGASQWRATFRYEVVFPSNKSLLVSGFGFDYPAAAGIPSQDSLRHMVPTACADASARAYKLSDFTRGYSIGEGVERGFLHSTDDYIGLHTVGGLRGLDFR